MGRPALPESERRKRRSLWLTDAELVGVEAAAAAEGCGTWGQWVRRLVGERLGWNDGPPRDDGAAGG